MIQVQRGDFNGQVLTVRGDDHVRAGVHPRRHSRGRRPPGSTSWASSAASPLAAPSTAPDVRRAHPAVTMARCRRRSALYLHIPFCAARCDYCSFATWTDRHHLTDAYLAACRADADRLVAAGMPPVTSVFVGGGTPSMVPAADLVAVLDRVPRAPRLRGHRRVQPRRRHRGAASTPTVAGGVNRLSFGVQSTSAHVLAALGRTHDRANVERGGRAGASARGSRRSTST